MTRPAVPWLVVLVCATGAVVAFAGEAEIVVSKAAARAAVRAFTENPLSEEGQLAAGLIVRFADQSDEVLVMIDATVLGWIAQKKPKHYLTLLAAYVAGNVRAQLETGVTRSDDYSGYLQLIAVYRRLQEREKDYRLPEMEKLLALYKDGKLLKSVLDWQKKRAEDEGEEAEQKPRRNRL